MNLRKRGVQLGYFPTAPCVSAEACPLLGKKGRNSAGLSEKWCHFTFAANDAPTWLANLSKEAGLSKKTLSLSLILLETRERSIDNRSSCRVISHTFPVPSLSGACRYGCASGGLRLLPDSQDLPSGSLTRGRLPGKPSRDKRSDALILEPLEARAKAKSPATSSSSRKIAADKPRARSRRSK